VRERRDNELVRPLLPRPFSQDTYCCPVSLRRITVAVQKPIVVVGSINTDLVAVTERIPAVGETVIGTDFQIHPGGKGANQAVAVARLGYPVRLIGRLGSDPFGAQLRTHLESAGVDIAGIATSE
jgi:ribokinase